jgi:ketosteroid isomerase-like protein
MTDGRAIDIVHAYYDSWKRGIQSFDATTVRSLFASDLVYEGPIVERRIGFDAFLPGLTRFVQSVRSFSLIQELQGEGEAAVLYDCDLTLPAGKHRFAEFFRVRDGKITELRLLYDATEYRKLS